MSFRKPFKPTFKSPLGDFSAQVDVSPAALSRPVTPATGTGNPFRVGLQPPMPVTAADRASAIYYGEALKFAKTSASAAVSVATDEVAEKAATAVLGKTVAVAVGVVAVPFAAADLFDVLAPGVKGWLTGGWKGGSGVGVLGVPQSPELRYGQANVNYTVEFSFRYYADSVGSSSAGSSVQYDRFGPFTLQEPLPFGLRSTYSSSTVIILTDVNSNPVISLQLGWGLVPGTLVIVYRRKDNQPDVPVLVQKPRAPQPYVSTPRPSNGQVNPGANPPPVKGNLPSTQRLSDLFKPTSDGRGIAPRLSDPTSPNPSSQTTPQSLTAPSPNTYPSAPRNPVPTFTEEDGCSPCMLKIGRKLEEIAEEQKKEKEDEKEDEPTTCETYPFVYSHGVCNSGEFTIEQRTLQLAEKPSAELRAEFDNMLVLAAQGCGKDAIASFPDWWQVRIGAERPQIVVAYRKEDSRTYHQIALPHPIDVAPWTDNKLGDYRKGPWSGVLILKDNSKFIVNCYSSAEAERMIARARSLIKPEMQEGLSSQSVARRGGSAVGEANLYGRKVSYFSTGQRNAVPDWTRFMTPTPSS